MAESESRDPRIDHLVESMFRGVFNEDERAELVSRIRAWEAANPGLQANARISAWIEIAYDYQAGH